MGGLDDVGFGADDAEVVDGKEVVDRRSVEEGNLLVSGEAAIAELALESVAEIKEVVTVGVDPIPPKVPSPDALTPIKV